MTTTAVLTTWVRTFQGSESDLHDYVVASLGDHVGDFDVDRLADQVLGAVNENLPAGLWLYSNGELVGPTGDDPSVAAEKLRQAVEDVDFWVLAERLDRNTTGEHVATYTQEGDIDIDGRPTGWNFDADGGTWRDQVRNLLTGHGFIPSGEWSTDADGNSTITVTDRR